MVRIGPLKIDPPLFLAPMAGVTDRDFRLIVRRIGGVGVVAMEFLNAKGLVAGNPQWKRIMVFSEEERPLAIQIYGSDPFVMAEAARIVEGVGADICDINMGCPANRVLKGCAGAALMGDLDLAERIISEARKAISIPLTVKFRVGLDDRRANYLELGRVCEANGVDAVALHGRTAKQMFRGESALAPIARLKEALSIPVLGNGDVQTPEDALRMLSVTGCDGVMIGRGATRNPWIFRQIAARLEGSTVAEASLGQRRDLILDHFHTVLEREEPTHALHKLRLFTNWYSRGLPGGQGLRRQIGGLPDGESFLPAIERFFAELEISDAA